MRVLFLILISWTLPGLVMSQSRKKRNKTPQPVALTAPGGYQYDIFGSGSQLKVEEGDLIYFNLQICHRDSVIEDSKKSIQVPEYVMPGKDLVVNDGPVASGLSVMALGDSLIIYERIDTIAGLPETMKDWKEIIYKIKVIGVTKKSELEEVKLRIPAIQAIIEKDIDDYYNQRFQKTLHTQSGVTVLVHEDGNGERFKPGEVTFVSFYAVSTKDRKYYGSTFESGRPFQVRLGYKSVIEGLDDALSMLKRGAVVTAFIPARLAYGAEGVPGALEPNTDMTFYIEVLDK